jgi:hypothetical protein
MQFSKNNAKLTTIFVTVLLMTSVSLITLQVQAALPNQEGGSTPGPLAAGVTADYTVKTHAFLSFRPNPVGVGQTILVNMWLNPAMHASRYMKNYTVTITKPNGDKEVKTMDSFVQTQQHILST